jgi:hypothetical protein
MVKFFLEQISFMLEDEWEKAAPNVSPNSSEICRRYLNIEALLEKKLRDSFNTRKTMLNRDMFKIVEFTNNIRSLDIFSHPQRG